MAFTLFNKTGSKNNIANIFNIINVSILLPAVSSDMIEESGFIASCVLLIIFIVFNMGYSLLKLDRLNKQSCLFACCSAANYLQLLCIVSTIIQSETPAVLSLLVIALILLAIYEVALKGITSVNKYVLEIAYLFFIGILTIGYDATAVVVGLSLLIILFMIYGFLTNNKIFKYASLIYIIPFILNYDIPEFIQLIVGIISFGILVWGYITKKEQYDSILKNFAYILFDIFVLVVFNRVLSNFDFMYKEDATIVFTILVIANILATHCGFCKDLVKDVVEEGTTMIVNIINALLMITGLILISGLDNGFCKFLAIIISVAVFSSNSKNLLTLYGERMWSGIYIGLKFTILLTTILGSFDSPSIMISLACLLFAIATIIFGFMLKYKSVRIYGLGLSLISVIKLTLIDIQYGSTLEHAISVFICGIVCFGISLMYNYVDKRIGK